MRSIRRLQFFIALTLTSMPAITQPADLAAQKEALDTIADFADRLCQSPPLEGGEQDFELSGSAKAELNEVVKKVVDLGIEGAAKYKSSEYQGVLQKDLANVVKDSSNCKREVWRDLKISSSRRSRRLTHHPSESLTIACQALHLTS